MKKLTKKDIILYSVIIIILSLVLIASLSGRRKAPAETSRVVEEVRVATVEKGEITDLITGTGSIESTGSAKVSLPGPVGVKKWLVSEGDYVTEGQTIAEIDKTTITAAMAEVTDVIKNIDRIIARGNNEEKPEHVTAPSKGRVKAIYAKVGDNVSDVMYADGALMLISLDGKMAVDVSGTGFKTGETLQVIKEDGRIINGTVAATKEGVITVIVPDDAAEYGEVLTVYDELGAILGGGEAYIHSQLVVSAYTGCVSAVHVSVNAEVSSGQRLISMSAAESTTSYYLMLSRRHELEESMHELLGVYEAGIITAPCSGRITELSVEDSDDGSQSTPDEEIRPLASRSDTPLMIFGEGPESFTVVGTVASVDDDKITVKYSDGSYGVTYRSELEGKTGSTDVSDISEGDIFAGTHINSRLSDAIFAGLETFFGGGSEPKTPSRGYSYVQPQGEAKYSVEDTLLCRLDDYSELEFSMEVDELDVLSVYVGMTAAVSLDAMDDTIYGARVTDISLEGRSSGTGTKYSVKLLMDRTENMLPGMNLTVHIPVSTYTNLLLVPLEAINEDDGGVFVYTAYDMETDTLTSPVYVETGLSDGERVQIVSGLEENDKVYYRYAMSIEYIFDV